MLDLATRTVGIVHAYGALPGEKYIKEIGFWIVLAVFVVGGAWALVDWIRKRGKDGR